jgi:hypothetical protein
VLRMSSRGGENFERLGCWLASTAGKRSSTYWSAPESAEALRASLGLIKAINESEYGLRQTFKDGLVRVSCRQFTCALGCVIDVKRGVVQKCVGVHRLQA